MHSQFYTLENEGIKREKRKNVMKIMVAGRYRWRRWWWKWLW